MTVGHVLTEQPRRIDRAERNGLRWGSLQTQRGAQQILNDFIVATAYLLELDEPLEEHFEQTLQIMGLTRGTVEVYSPDFIGTTQAWIRRTRGYVQARRTEPLDIL